MFYKYNSLISRLTPSTQAEAYIPQGLSPLKGSPPVIIFDSKKTQVAREPEAKARSAAGDAKPQATSAAAVQGLHLGVVPVNSQYRKIMELQNMFLKDDGKLVWQKLGRDRLSYLATLGLMAVGTMFSLSIIFRMSFPRKSEG